MQTSGKIEDSTAGAGMVGAARSACVMDDGHHAIPLPPYAESGEVSRGESSSASSPGVWSTFDYAAALYHAGGEADLLVQIAKAFCVNAHGLRCRLREGIDRHDLQTVRIVAHTLKGGALQFASIRAGTVARELEEAAANRNWPDVYLAHEAFEFELSRLLPELAALAALPSTDREDFP